MTGGVMTRPAFVLAISLICSACGSMSAPKVTPATDDQSLTVRVRAALMNAPAVHASEIDVTTAGGVVTLSGHVHGQQEVDAAVATALRVSGVKDVRSQLLPDR
jgi:hyperosmotically inducible periplasmic protein